MEIEMPVILGPLKLIKESGSLLDRIAKKVIKNSVVIVFDERNVKNASFAL